MLKGELTICEILKNVKKLVSADEEEIIQKEAELLEFTPNGVD